MPLMVVESLLRLRNTLEQPKSGFSFNHKEIAFIVAISLFFLDQVYKLTAMVDCINICAPGMCPCSSVDRASALLEP